MILGCTEQVEIYDDPGPGREEGFLDWLDDSDAEEDDRDHIDDGDVGVILWNPYRWYEIDKGLATELKGRFGDTVFIKELIQDFQI